MGIYGIRTLINSLDSLDSNLYSPSHDGRESGLVDL